MFQASNIDRRFEGKSISGTTYKTGIFTGRFSNRPLVRTAPGREKNSPEAGARRAVMFQGPVLSRRNAENASRSKFRSLLFAGRFSNRPLVRTAQGGEREKIRQSRTLSRE